MTNEETTQMQQLIQRDKQQVKELTSWRNCLVDIENDKEEHLLDRFNAYKERIWCDNMIASINAQLFSYANILNNMKNAIK